MVLFTFLLSFLIRWFWIIAPIFVLYLLLNYFNKNNHKKGKVFLIHTNNDFYEDLLPLGFLIILTINKLYFIILLFIHVLIFKNKIVWTFSKRIYHHVLKRIYYFLYGIVYRKWILWLYYKAFFNKYIIKMSEKQK
jgi:hypothetical protein